MTRKATVLYWTDVLNAALFLTLIGTGTVMKWVLPPGSGHRAGGGRWRGDPETLLSWTRHDWGDAHFWIAVSMVALITIHLALHLGWIRAATRSLMPARTPPGRPDQAPAA